MTSPYQPKYCEENIWWLASSDEPGAPMAQRRVVFISSATQSCLLFGQRECDPVVWDYHVVLWVAQNDGGVIWDLDTTLPQPCGAETYLRSSFPYCFEPNEWPALCLRTLEQSAAQRARQEGQPNPRLEFEPRFLVLDASVYVERFGSSRQHMIGPDGEWLAEPPPWPCIQEGDLLLSDLIHQQGAGRRHDLQSLLQCATEHRLPRASQ